MKLYIKIEKKNNYKTWWYWNWKHKFHQYKRTISIKNIDINKIVVSNKVFLGTKMLKKLDLYKYLSEKSEHTEETLMKFNTCHFWEKMINY